MLADSDVLEQAYLISRGVRSLALLESVACDEKEMRDCFVRLNTLTACYEDVIPFVLPRPDMNCAMTGFAVGVWVIDLLRWAYDQPLRQQHQIVGLLLGYAPGRIGEHDAREFAGNPSQKSRSR